MPRDYTTLRLTPSCCPYVVDMMMVNSTLLMSSHQLVYCNCNSRRVVVRRITSICVWLEKGGMLTYQMCMSVM